MFLEILGSTLGMFGWGWATETLKPLANTGSTLAEFCYPILVKRAKESQV